MTLIDELLHAFSRQVCNGFDPEMAWSDLLTMYLGNMGTDYRQIGRQAQAACEGQDTDRLMGTEMMAVWMTEQPDVVATSEGLRLLSWLGDLGIVSARLNLSLAMMRLSDEPEVFRNCIAVLNSLLRLPDLPARMVGTIHYSLGAGYIEGRGVSQDWTRAYEHHRKAADLGHPQAAFNMGLAYDNKLQDGDARERIFPVNYSEAARYYTIASKAGMLAARTNLAILHYSLAFPQARQEYGRRLLLTAARDGDETATRAMELLGVDPRGRQQPDAKLGSPEYDWQSDMSRITHHTSLDQQERQAGAAALNGKEVPFDPDNLIISSITDLLMRSRAMGHLADEEDFCAVLRRIETAHGRSCLISDYGFWRSIGYQM